MAIQPPSYIAGLVPYKPGKPIDELERELGIKNSIKLASNENPLGPSPKAIAAVTDTLGRLHRYPDGNSTYLKNALAAHTGLATENIIVGTGSNEIIELAIRTFLGRDQSAVMSEHAFVVYKLIVTAAGGRCITTPMTNRYTHDLAAMAAAVTDDTRLLFIASPNNPTGTYTTAAELDALLADLPDTVLVVLDEAYAEFVDAADYPDSFAVVKTRTTGAPVLALRTFSKLYGLAGLRVGYGVTRPDIADYMNRVRQPFNVNMAAQVAAEAALADTEHVEKTRALTRDGMAYLQQQFDRLELAWIPSAANFLMVDVGRDAHAVFTALLHTGVIVRAMPEYGFPTHIRVTVGLPDENERFIKELEAVLTGGA